jgi:hypothetical protein
VFEDELRGIEAAVRLAQQSAAERLTAFDAAEVGVGQAEENLRIREQQFEAGRATSDDVLEAVAVLALQRATLAVAPPGPHPAGRAQQLMGRASTRSPPRGCHATPGRGRRLCSRASAAVFW